MWSLFQRQPRKGVNVALSFPNCSRDYDAARQGVRFWGYDRSMEASFLVTSDALRRIAPGMRSDAVDLLRVFDRNRDRIHAIATRIYARHPKSFLKLIAADVW